MANQPFHSSDFPVKQLIVWVMRLWDSDQCAGRQPGARPRWRGKCHANGRRNASGGAAATPESCRQGEPESARSSQVRPSRDSPTSMFSYSFRSFSLQFQARLPWPRINWFGVSIPPVMRWIAHEVRQDFLAGRSFGETSKGSPRIRTNGHSFSTSATVGPSARR